MQPLITVCTRNINSKQRAVERFIEVSLSFTGHGAANEWHFVHTVIDALTEERQLLGLITYPRKNSFSAYFL
jgi:hypothetical protein